MLDKREPFGFLTFVKGSAIKECGGKRRGLEVLSWAVVALNPRGLPVDLLPALGKDFQDIRGKLSGFSSGKGCLKLLGQVLRWRLTQDGNVPGLLQLVTSQLTAMASRASLHTSWVMRCVNTSIGSGRTV
jgi:hypothetical protein